MKPERWGSPLVQKKYQGKKPVTRDNIIAVIIVMIMMMMMIIIIIIIIIGIAQFVGKGLYDRHI